MGNRCQVRFRLGVYGLGSNTEPPRSTSIIHTSMKINVVESVNQPGGTA